MHYVKSTPLQEVEGGGGASASAALRYAGLRSAAAAHAILHDAQHLSALVLRSHAVKIVEKHLVRSSADHAASETGPKERAQGGSGDTEARNLRINSVWRQSDRSRGHRWAFPLVEWMVCRMRGKGVPGATARSSAIFESAVVASTSSSRAPVRLRSRVPEWKNRELHFPEECPKMHCGKGKQHAESIARSLTLRPIMGIHVELGKITRAGD
jgi:hypothetical protein